VRLSARAGSAAARLLLHIAGDWIPHEDIPDRAFEIGSGIGGVPAFFSGAVRDHSIPRHGALAASCPTRTRLRFPRPGGRKVFPSHRLRGWHRSGGVSAPVQLFLAGS